MSYKNIELIKKLFFPLNIELEKLEDLHDIEIDRDLLFKNETKLEYDKLIFEFKALYKTSRLNCLHENRNSKQKFPQVNLLRQILKCNNLKLKPKTVSLGYSKITGKKMVKRSYIIKDLLST